MAAFDKAVFLFFWMSCKAPDKRIQKIFFVEFEVKHMGTNTSLSTNHYVALKFKYFLHDIMVRKYSH